MGLGKTHFTGTKKLEVAQLFGAVFIIGIGANLSNGEPHDGRAPDYDDWSTINEDGYVGLNGDIILWNPVIVSEKCSQVSGRKHFVNNQKMD